MDGSYNHPFGRSQSPMSAKSTQSPTSSYQVNVSRQKTRKWVEAKKVDYGGDDWGADEFDDEEPQEPVPPVPAKNARPPAARLPSESRHQNLSGMQVPASLQPGPAAANAPADLPPLQVETNAASASPVTTQQPEIDDLKSAPVPDSTTLGEIQGRPYYVTPKNSVTGRGAPRPSAAAEDQPPMPPPKNDLSNVNETSNTAPDVPLKPTAADSAMAKDADINRKAASGSPQLPNLSRLSGIGMDFQSASISPDKTPSGTSSQRDSANVSSAGTEVVEPTTGTKATQETPAGLGLQTETNLDEVASADRVTKDSPARPSLPGGWVTETPSVGAETPQVEEQKTMPDAAEAAPAQSTQQVNQEPVVSASAVASPAPGSTYDFGTPQTVSSEIPHTQPLQPGKAQWHSPLVGYELRPIDTHTSYNTTGSTPDKESDKLRDEIMRSLTPLHDTPPAALPVTAQAAPAPAADSDIKPLSRESTYSLSGYDAYWADTVTRGESDAKQRKAEQTVGTLPVIADDIPPVAPLSPGKQAAATSQEPTSDDKKRFSWEMGDAKAAQAAPAVAKDATPTPSEPQTVDEPSSSLPTAVQSQDTAPTIDTTPKEDATAPSIVVEETLAAPAEQPAIQAPGIRHVAASDDDGTEVSPTQVGPSPSAIQSPTTTSQAQLPSFREIMGRPSSAERIAKFDETRETFATMDSGLDHWITDVKSQHAEHTNLSPSFQTAGAGPSAISPSTPGFPNTPQPYYQQVINANHSSQAINSPTTAPRTRLGAPTGPGAGTGSSFGPSSNQIGAKSKELMQSAGKMGMGLLSKGRNKLRGTGDKVFH